MKSSRTTPSPQADLALWAALGGLLAVNVAYFALRPAQPRPPDTGHDLLRVGLTLGGLLLPWALMTWQSGARPAAWLGQIPPASLSSLSLGLGLAPWAGLWWLMSLLNQGLTERVGPYQPSFWRLERWDLQVIYFAALLPLGTALLVFGLMRQHLQTAERGRAIALMALYFAALNAVTTPQGLAGLPAYGLLGAIAAWLSLRTGALLPGLMAYAGFMYGNQAFLDELLREVGAIPLEDMRWLSLALFSAFAALILSQVIRYRSEAPPSPPKSKTQAPEEAGLSSLGYAALVGLVLIVLFYAASEFDQRNELQSQLESAQAGADHPGLGEGN